MAAITAVTDKDFELTEYGDQDYFAELQALEVLNSDINADLNYVLDAIDKRYRNITRMIENNNK